MTNEKPRSSTIRKLSEALHLPRTSERILESLAKAGKFLPVKELVRRVKMSERGIRTHLSVLVGRGLLQRRAVPRGSRKIAYEYSLKPIHELLNAAREEYDRTFARLEMAFRRMRQAKVNPKNASSSRS